MSNPPSSADDALRRIDADVASAQARAARATEFRHEVESMRGAGRSGAVAVTVDPVGALVDLELPDDLSRTSGRRLRDDILAAQRLALVAVADQIRVRTAEAFGEDSATTRRMEAELDARLER